MFTRGGEDLSQTAIFIGGSNRSRCRRADKIGFEGILRPVRVSVMLDANGCNTTAAAAVVAASRHISLRNATALVLGGTDPVGQRVAQLLALDGAKVTLTSRTQTKADSAAEIQNRAGRTQSDGNDLGNLLQIPIFLISNRSSS